MGPTIMTGTSEVELGGTGARLKVPMDGTLTAIKIEAARAGVPTTVESDTIVVRLTSNSVPLAPFECFAQPVNAGVGAEIKPFKEEAPWIPVNAPVKTGDEIKVTGAELVACTVHPYVAVTFEFADFVAVPQYHSIIGTHTACGATATETKMTTGINIVGGSWIKTVYALLAEVTPASGKGCIQKYRLTSTNFKHDGTRGMEPKSAAGDIEFAGEFIPAMLSAGPTDGAKGARLTIMPEDVPLGTPCHVDAYHENAVAYNAAAYFNIQILYI
jgi:hypothetical protein